MRVLIISFSTFPAAPSSPAYVAGAALQAGHTVEIFDCFLAPDLSGLEEQLTRFQPHVVGISIKFVTGDVVDERAPFGTHHFDHRGRVKELVRRVQRVSSAPIVLGGPGFNYFGRAWLDYLELDYGIRGEAERAFPLYLQRLAEGGDVHTVPGCIYRHNGRFVKVACDLVPDLDGTAYPAYELFDLDAYAARGVSPAILTKRGCALRCTFCLYSSLEGTRYRLKSPRRVVDEMARIQRVQHPTTFTFCDNSFNVPRSHAEAICRDIINRKLDLQWSAGALKPLGVTDELCQLFKASGCVSLNLAVESASARMLTRMRRGYTVEQVERALTCLTDAGIPFGISLMFGAPSESPQTIVETFDLVDRFPVPDGIWVSIGICLWTHHQAVLEEARRAGQLAHDKELFDGAYYVSPELPRNYMIELIGSLRARENCTVQVNRPYAGYA